MSKKKSLTSEERVAAVQEYLDGKGGYKAIARKYNIGATTMKRMVCRAKTEGIESVAKASPYRLSDKRQGKIQAHNTYKNHISHNNFYT